MNLNYTIIQVLQIIKHVYSRSLGSKRKQKHIQIVGGTINIYHKHIFFGFCDVSMKKEKRMGLDSHEVFFLVNMFAELKYSMLMVLGFISSGSPSTWRILMFKIIIRMRRRMVMKRMMMRMVMRMRILVRV